MWFVSTQWLACSPSPLPLTPPDRDTGAPTTIGWAQVAVDGAGAAWVSWVEVDGPLVLGTFVARSDAPGAPLGEPIRVPTAEPPIFATTEKPSLAASADRLALGYTGRGTRRHGDAKVAYVQTADLRGAWSEPLAIDALSATDRVTEQMRVAFSAEGELWAAWKRQVYGVSDHPHWAREDNGFTPEEVRPELSEGHDCSPPDFRFGPSGRPLYALRSNLLGLLQTFLVAGTDDDPLQISDDQWPYHPDVCPVDGPRVAEQADGTVTVAWLAPSEGVWRLHVARSADGGATFSAPELGTTDVGLGERWVAMAAEGDRRWIAVESVHGSTQVLDADGAIAPLTSPEGAPLTEVELAANAGRAVAVGRDPSGRLHLVELDR